MDRKIIGQKGISLIELLFVIVIIVIIAGLSILNFSRWYKKYKIESDVKEISGFIQKARAIAFTQKKSLVIIINNKQVELNDINGNTISTLNLENSFQSNTIKISQRGIISSGSNVLISSISGLNPQYNCIVISDLRVRPGFSSDGSNCSAK